MVLAAWLRRIPAALTEADAHLGLANRLAAPFAQRLFLAYPIDGMNGKARVVGRPIPSTSQPVERDEARRRFELPQDGPVVLVFGGEPRARARSTRPRSTRGAPTGPAVLHLSRRARLRRAARPRLPAGLPAAAVRGRLRRGARRRRPRRLARGGSVWEIAAAGRPAMLVPYPDATANHQLKNAEYFDRAGGVEIVDDERGGRARAACSSRSCSPTPRGSPRWADAMRAAAKPDAADRIADELIELAAARR